MAEPSTATRYSASVIIDLPLDLLSVRQRDISTNQSDSPLEIMTF